MANKIIPFMIKFQDVTNGLLNQKHILICKYIYAKIDMN